METVVGSLLVTEADRDVCAAVSGIIAALDNVEVREVLNHRSSPDGSSSSTQAAELPLASTSRRIPTTSSTFTYSNNNNNNSSSNSSATTNMRRRKQQQQTTTASSSDKNASDSRGLDCRETCAGQELVAISGRPQRLAGV